MITLLTVLPLAASDWVSSADYGGRRYFFISSPAEVRVYSIASRSWETPITLPTTLGSVTAGTVDADGLYVAYGTALYRHSLAGTNPTPLGALASPVHGLFTDGSLILAVYSTGLYARVASLSKTTNSVIATGEYYVDSLFGAAISREENRLVGVSQGVSPADVTYASYSDVGAWTGSGDSPHHGDYSIGTRAWVFPGGTRFLDTTGNVYSTTSMSHLGALGTAVDWIAFNGTDTFVVLRSGALTAFGANLFPAGSKSLAATAKEIVVSGDRVVAFRSATGAGIDTEEVLLSDLAAPTPGTPIDPTGLPFTPDAISERGNVVYLLSKVHQSIFRWDSISQRYLATIPLIGVPSHFAVSPASDRLYIAYASGLIYSIDLAAATLQERPFTTLPSAPFGLSLAGRYLFAADNSGAWNTHYTFDEAGVQISAVDWNYYSTEYIWSDVRQRMYFFRDDTSPNDLLSEQINANGVAYPGLAAGAIGTYMDSPLHTSTGFTHPIRVSPDGTRVMLGSGMVHDATTLARAATGLANAFTDGDWYADGFVSMRLAGTMVQLQQWSGPALGQGSVLAYAGTPLRLLRNEAGNFVAISKSAAGVPAFSVYAPSLSVVSPVALAQPTGLASSLAVGLLTLSWNDVSGEEDYLVERRTLPGGEWGTVATVASNVPTYVDGNVTLNTSYEYRVTARAATVTSLPSAPLEIAFAAPAVPVLEGQTVSASEIRLNWQSMPRATSYRIERRAGTTLTWSTLTTLTSAFTTYANTGLSPAVTYTYRLVALNALGASTSAELALTTPTTPPSTPTLYSATPTALSVSLTWFTVDRAATYRIERTLVQPISWAPVGSATAPSTTYLDTTVAPSTSYLYRAIAINSAGESAPSSSLLVTTPALTPPQSPTLATPVNTADGVKLTWADVANEQGYRVRRRIGEGTTVILATVAPGILTYTDTTATAGTYYNYTIEAFNAAGSGVSNEINVRAVQIGSLVYDTFDPSINGPAWSEVSGGLVTTGPAGFRSGNALWMGGDGPRRAMLAPLDTSLGATVRFFFRAGNLVTDGATHWDTSEAGESVILEGSVNGSTWISIATIVTLYPWASTWERYSYDLPQSLLGPATYLRLRQSQHSGAGYDCWALDDVEVRGAVASIPAPPAWLHAVADGFRSVSLAWTAAAEATSYVIERQAGTAGWIELATTSAGVGFFVDTTVLPGQHYSYQVRSRNSAGVSAPSVAVSVDVLSSLIAWRFSNYGTVEDTGAARWDEDNGTGVSNLLRYAFNLAASEDARLLGKITDGKGLPRADVDAESGRLRCSFLRRNAAGLPGITYTVEFSPDLLHWSATGTEISVEPVNETMDHVVVEDSEPASPARYMRVRVE